MSTDFEINEQLNSEWNSVGDVETVEGDAFIRQSVGISVLENVNLSAPPLNATDIEEQRGDIEQAVQNNEHTQEPIVVELANVDVDEQLIEYDVSTKEISDTLTVG